VLGTTGTGFLQNDACWRSLDKLPPGDLPSAFYVHLDVADRPGVLAHVADCFAEQDVSIAQLAQHLVNGTAALDLVTHEAPAGRVEAALSSAAALVEVRSRPEALRMITERGF
jgi:homoserine dehydrogenase